MSFAAVVIGALRFNDSVTREGSWALPLTLKTLLYQTGQPPNTTTPLALFGGSLQIEHIVSLSILSNRAIMLKSSFIRSMTWFPPNRATLAW